MATISTISTFLSKPLSPLPSISTKPDIITSTSSSSSISFPSVRLPLRRFTSPLHAAAVPSTTKSSDERVKQVHSLEEFDTALRTAKSKLVVVEFAASHSRHSRQIYPFMVELSRTCADVDFLLVMGDESDSTRELCRREKIDKVPHFTFYKAMEKVHEEEGIGPDELVGDVLYYGDNHSAVVQLHSREEVEKLIREHGSDGKLVVLDVGLKHCGPCVKVYPTVVKLSRSMAGTVVFARMNGDENDSCMEYLKDMGVVEVPTFLFLRDGELCGRYVGSGKGELIGEILRYQGVRVT
ncbi:hypothetical protein KSP39_PZI022878 [Platanthera zijinensis]|uniref:Thioredoxin domain-containing protein n=1 Tax=Platanthera zijinensis TaxID=2320716 RepID=A0AAP0AVL7_9ASPA